MDGRRGAPHAMSLAIAVSILGLMVFFGGLSAFFSAAETALFSLGKSQIARLRETLPHRAATVDALFANPRRLLSMILLADTLTNLPLCLVSLYLLHDYSSWHWHAPADRSAEPALVPFWSAALGLFVLIVFVCDLLPKMFALRQPERVARSAVETLHRLRPWLSPACGGLQVASEWLVNRLTPRHVRVPLKLTEAEFGALVEAGAQDGALGAAESEMIQEIIKLGDKTAKDCMTPRVEAFTVVDDLSNEEMVALLRQERRHRVPVYGETPDDIVGVLDARRFLRLVVEAGADIAAVPHYTEIMDPPSYVSETMRALDLLRGFLSRPQGLAILVDEYGGTEGVVTLSDIVEEIVGDALPSGEEDLYIEALDDDRLLVGGHARLDDISEHEGFTLEADGLDTIGGLIFNRLGYLPKVGSVLQIPPGLQLTIRRGTGKRVTEVLIEKTAHESKDEDPAG